MTLDRTSSMPSGSSTSDRMSALLAENTLQAIPTQLCKFFDSAVQSIDSVVQSTGSAVQSAGNDVQSTGSAVQSTGSETLQVNNSHSLQRGKLVLFFGIPE